MIARKKAPSAWLTAPATPAPRHVPASGRRVFKPVEPVDLEKRNIGEVIGQERAPDGFVRTTAGALRPVVLTKRWSFIRCAIDALTPGDELVVRMEHPGTLFRWLWTFQDLHPGWRISSHKVTGGKTRLVCKRTGCTAESAEVRA